MKPNTQTEAGVLAALNKFMKTYQERDLDGLLKVISSDDDVFMFGTGADEKRTGRDEFKFQAERDWSQTEALAFKLDWYRISSEGPVAWIAGEGVGEGKAGGQVFEFPFRMTTVLKQIGNEWYFVQMHVGLPAPGQEPGNSVPV
jgi:ketosteroid isomerase-like protein